MKTVLPLMPEPITREVNATKNDCEVRALERILKKLRGAAINNLPVPEQLSHPISLTQGGE